jgi:hypothetical protein
MCRFLAWNTKEEVAERNITGPGCIDTADGKSNERQ